MDEHRLPTGQAAEWRDSIQQRIEQAAADSGAENEERNSDRIMQQSEELDRLVAQRDALLSK